MVRAVRRGRVGQTSQHLAVLAAALLGCRGEVVEVEPPEPRPTAVVLVVVDTLRADFTSYAGYPKSTTPVLDRLAAEGVVFEQAYAPSGWTVPSMASLMTSLHPSSHGVVFGSVRDNQGFNQPVLSRAHTTLAEVFQAAGWRTAGVPANRHLSRRLGFGQGFDAYYDDAQFMPAHRLNGTARRVLQRAYGPAWALDWRQEPTLLWLHYFDPHAPYVARRPWVDQFEPAYADRPEAYPTTLRTDDLLEIFPVLDDDALGHIVPLYASEIRHCDDHIGRMVDILRADADDVLLVLTSDHGEEFAEHGGLGHAHTLHEELVRVPLFIRWPAGIEGGRRLTQPVSLLDLVPTLAELAGIEPPPTAQGQSLAPLLRGETLEPASLLFELHPPRTATTGLRKGPWKLLRDPEGTALFDLSVDPTEQDDVSEAHPEVVAELGAEMDAMVAALPMPPPPTYVELNDDVRAELEALGYMVEEPSAEADGEAVDEAEDAPGGAPGDEAEDAPGGAAEDAPGGAPGQ